MEDQGTATPQAPGWDADPYGRHELRYWDGAEWTDHVSDAGVTGSDPAGRMSPWAAMAAVSAAAPETPTAPAPAPTASPRPVTTPTPATTGPAPVATPHPAPAPAAPVGARPAGPSGAWDAPVILAPASVAPPAWGPPTGPSAPRQAPRQAPIGAPADLTPMPKRSWRPRWWMVAAICLVVIVGGGYVIFRPPARIDADPPAATPAGFRVVDSGDYRIATPDAWVSQEVTSEARDQVKQELEDRAPGITDRFEDSEAQIDGTMTLAADPVTRDNLTVVQNHWMRGDPTDADTLDDIRAGFDDDMPGSTISGLSAAASDVHGFPAATLTYTATVGSVTVYQVMTLVQTGDHVFQVTVTSTSPDRAAALSRQILPTFDPV